MEPAPHPDNEKERLQTLKALKILNTPPEERFDRITHIATRFFDVPISTVTLVDSDNEWYKSCDGLSERSADRSVSFCGHTINYSRPLIVPDTLLDKRFLDNPMVTGAPNIRFYAGVPIITPDGFSIGAFCIKDNKPRKLSDQEIEDLKAFAAWAELEINAEDMSKSLIGTKFQLWKNKH